MFTSVRIDHPGGFIEYRTEDLTGLRTRICPERLRRGISSSFVPDYSEEGCPFCPDLVNKVTPVFSDGLRIYSGESVTFPNLYPFAAYHVVTAITREHSVQRFSARQISDALAGQIRALREQDGYVSINWNYLPSSGASLPHPHLQGLADRVPDTLPGRYLTACREYFSERKERYFDIIRPYEEKYGRSLPGTRLFWYVHPVPIGEREIRCILPLTVVRDMDSIREDFSADLVSILGLYQDLGTSAFNMSIFFGKDEDKDHFSAFCSVISRINPNPLSISDTAFMERLHLEPVILTLPEDLAAIWREYSQSR